MESLFENKHTRDEACMKEYFKYFYFGKPVLMVISIFFAIGFIFGIVSVFYPEIPFNNTLRAIYIFTPLFVWTVNILRYFKAVKISIMRDRETNNGSLVEILYIVSDEKVEVICESKGMKNSVCFSQIKKVIKTKSLIILITEARLSLIFKNDSFIKGTSEEFLSFLKNKGFKV
jgi:hypothetical protein